MDLEVFFFVLRNYFSSERSHSTGILFYFNTLRIHPYIPGLETIPKPMHEK